MAAKMKGKTRFFEATTITRTGKTGRRLGIVRARTRKQAATKVAEATGAQRLRVFPVKLVKKKRR